MPIIRKQTFVPFAIFAAIFLIQALIFSFTQDDAFISYRYVKNFIDGYGLVFNPGEFVEGYTNFFFIILMTFFHLTGLDLIIISKIIGLVSGIAILALAVHWVSRDEKKWSGNLAIFLVPILLSANSAFAYWAISGLETVLFSALIFFGMYLGSGKKILFSPVLALAALCRPEGVLVFGLIILYYLLVKDRQIKYILSSILIFALLTLPFLIFRISYYGDILPNPFYAKTGWSSEYLRSGFSYTILFMKHYGFFGLLIALPLAGYKLLPHRMRLVLFVTIGYLLYILMIGGDVLHGYRFFIPVLPPLYMLFSITVLTLFDKLFGVGSKRGWMAAFIVLPVLGVVTFLIPYNAMTTYRQNERSLVGNMTYLSELIGQARHDRYTIGCTTIGAFSYHSRAIVIDMLGLTDRVIGKTPLPFDGIESTWKERNYNIQYLMKRNPDLILFSTGLKPSAPAEQALFLSSKFRKGYYPVFHESSNGLWAAYKRKSNYKGVDSYYPNAEFINLYTTALNRKLEGQNQLAFEYARQSMEKAPPDFYLPLVLMGRIRMEQNRVEEGLGYLKRAMHLSDDYALTACDMLRQFYETAGEESQAESYLEIIRRYNRLN